jgi:hypothetical protein
MKSAANDETEMAAHHEQGDSVKDQKERGDSEQHSCGGLQPLVCSAEFIVISHRLHNIKARSGSDRNVFDIPIHSAEQQFAWHMYIVHWNEPAHAVGKPKSYNNRIPSYAVASRKHPIREVLLKSRVGHDPIKNPKENDCASNLKIVERH